MADVSFKIDGARLQRSLGRLHELGDDIQTLWEDMGEDLHLIARVCLDNDKSGSNGERWEELLDATIERKVADSKHGKILQQDLFLRDSFSHKASGAGVEFGSNLMCAANHQYGDNSRSIPPQPFLSWGTEEEAALGDVPQQHLERVLSR